MSLLLRAHLRHLWQERWQALLALLGIAVGVAVVVAVDLVNASSREAMGLASARLAGTATHEIVGPGGRIDERLYAGLRRDWRGAAGPLAGATAFTPVVEGRAALRVVHGAQGAPDQAVLSRAQDGLRVRLLGVDPVSDASVRAASPALAGGSDANAVADADADAESDAEAEADTADGLPGARLLVERGAVAIDRRTADRLGIRAGARLELVTAAGPQRVTVIGLLPAVDGLIGEGLVLADIATAQELLGRGGWIDRIELMLPAPRPEGSAFDRWLERVFPGLVVDRRAPDEVQLDDGLRLISVADRVADTRSLASSFQLNLAALGLLAVVVGLFLIHGTLRYSVLRRQRQFGRLRALGVTPAELRTLILFEAAVLGVLGAGLGLLLGRILAGTLLALVSATLEGLYDQVAIGALAPDPVPYLKGLLVGIAGALLVTLPLALRAAGEAPRALLLGSLSAPRPASRSWWGAGLCVVVATIALLPGTGYLGALVAVGALLLLGALLAPWLVARLLGLLARGALRAPVGTRMLLREATRGLARSGVASAALVVAVATAVGMGIMVESFRDSVERWLESRLAAPLYVRVPLTDAPLDPAVEALLDFGTTGRVMRHSFADRVRPDAAEVPSAERPIASLPVTVSLVQTRGEVPEDLDLVLLAGRRDGRGALVSEPLARDLDLLERSIGGLGAFAASGAPGSGGRGLVLRDDAALLLDLGSGPGRIPVAGVFREYGGGRGTLILPAARWPMPPPGVRTFELRGVGDPDGLAEALLARLPPGSEVRRNEELLALSLQVFDRTFRVTAVLQTLAGLVAAIGLFGALSALALERRAQYGVLRALGVARRIPALQNLLESLLVAAAAALLAMPLGIVVAWVLVEFVNVRAFGWSLDMSLSPWLFAEALLVALAAGVAAAAAPALRLWRTPAVRMLADARALG